MKHFLTWPVAACACVVLAGCNSLGGVPEFTSSSIAPQPLHSGDTALITIGVKDKNEIIRSIVGEIVIDGDTIIELPLNDSGEEGDVKAGDDIWSLGVAVPVNAPTGDFNVTFTAYRSDGIAVPIRDERGEITALSVELPLTISYKQ